MSVINPLAGKDGKDFRIMQRFHTPVSYTASGIHGALDIAPKAPGEKGIVLKAAHEGYVKVGKDKDLGNYISIISQPYTVEGEKRKSIYAHLEKVGVKSGQFVHMGDPVGVMGTTGFSTNVHLHWEYWVLKKGRWVLTNVEPYIVYYYS